MSRRKAEADEATPAGPDKLPRKDYERELARLHVELVKLQEWVKHQGLKVCVVFKGRDGAGKGGTIKAIAQRVSRAEARRVGRARGLLLPANTTPHVRLVSPGRRADGPGPGPRLAMVAGISSRSSRAGR